MRRRVFGPTVLLTLCMATGPGFAAGYRIVEIDGVTYVSGVDIPPGSGESGRPHDYQALVLAAATRHGVDSRLVEAVIRAESGFDRVAESPKGAIGLMQLMPRTAAGLGVRDATDASANIEGGVRHLRYLLDRYAGDVSLAVAAYNAGERTVDFHRGVPPYLETQRYVERVLRWAGPPRAGSRVLYRVYDRDGTMIFGNIPPRPGRSSVR